MPQLSQQDARALHAVVAESVKLDEFTIELMPVSKTTELSLRMRIQQNKYLLQLLDSFK